MVLARVARLFIFRPKIPIWVNFWMALHILENVNIFNGLLDVSDIL
jgi:hypothetical protein